MLQDSRRAARATADGDFVLLAHQDRLLWDRDLTAEGAGLLDRAIGSGPTGPYAVQAAITAAHAKASTAEATDWQQIVKLYDLLLRTDPSPVIELNRAVAVAMRDGPAAGLALIDAMLTRGDLQDHRLAHAARADLLRRLGQTAEARDAYERARDLTRTEPERRFIERRLAELADARHDHASGA